MNPKKILVVRDDREKAEQIANELGAHGFEICGACTAGGDALAVAWGERPHLAIVDLSLGGDAGDFETARILKREFKIPVVFLPGDSEVEDGDAMQEAHSLGYVAASDDFEHLRTTIDMALHYSRLDRELSRGAEWFSTTLNSIGDGIVATDISGRVNYLNDIAEQMTGWTLDEVEGKPIEEIFSVRNSVTGELEPNPAREALDSGEICSVSMDSLLVRRDGGQLPIDNSGAPIRDGEGKVVGGVLVFRDVSERKEHEEELRQYRQRLEGLVENRTDALKQRIRLERLVVEISAELIRLREEDSNETFRTALARIGDAMSLDGCGIFELTTPSEEDPLDRPLLDAAWVRNLNASSADQSPGGSDLSWWAAHLNEAGGVMILDSDEIPEEAGAERQVIDLWQIKSMVVLPLACGETIDRLLLFSSSEQRDWSDDDLVIFEILAGIFKSVFERLELEAEQEALQEQLIQSQKLEAIGKLSGGIAHDFNNMLVPIIGYADVVLMNPDLGRNEAEIREIRKAAESAASLTRQLLAFSRKQVLEKQYLSLNGLIEDLQGMLKRTLGEEIKLELDLDEDLDFIEADRNQLEQVLMNLSVNARDAMPHGGSLAVRTRTLTDRNGKQACVAIVEDTGQGMSKDLMARVFDPFFTTKGMEGTGLGLSVVLGIVQQHDGWVKVDSKEGVGTRFVIGLPPAENADDIDLSESFDVPNRVTQGEGERVLLIEDEPSVVQFVRRALQSHGYEVEIAMTQKAAIEAYDQAGGNFDLVFADAKLPDGNGMEVLRHVFDDRPDMKALLSSGYTDDRALVDQARQLGVEYLQKPYGLDELYATVSGVLHGGSEVSRDLGDDSSEFGAPASSEAEDTVELAG